MITPNKDQILHYKILSKIGAGGMGEVFLAQDTKLDRKVALKILPSEFAEDKDRMSRFVREAKSASALNHPNIITIHEIGEADGTHFIATEFIDGKTLNDYKQANPLNYKSALEIAIQVASALDEAHLAGIVHRDIKPDNVMIRANGLAKILDFGIAKLAGRGDAETRGHGEEDKTLIAASPRQPVSASQSTMPGMIIGTANYMSPEQAKGKVVDVRTDIFSFGVVLYEMIAGQLPFEGENALEMIGAILKDEPKSLNADVPTEITKIINKCLRKDRDERYQTIKDVGNDLKDVKQDLEFHDKLERSIVPNQDDNKTQILKVTTLDEINQTTTNQTVVGNSKVKYLTAGLLTLVLAIGGFFGYEYLSPTTPQINSIAVLPFENKSSDADSEYLSDGLAESLIYRLSQIPDLKVSPTSSVFRYKGKETDPQVVAKELGVDSVMTGRITQRGDNLTISVNLVDTRNGIKSLWGEQYERKMSELLNTQREIASEITNKLQLKLSGAGEQKLTKKYTDNNEAYQFYLKGKYHYAKRTKEDILKGIENFEQAIALDPNFALAYVEISDSYSTMPAYPYMSPKEAFPKAKAAAEKALAIDPTLAEAHSTLGFSLAVYDWNWAKAKAESEKAIELNPNLAFARFRYGWNYLLPIGSTKEAIKELKQSLELDRMALVANAGLAIVYADDRQNEQALIQARKIYDLEPNFPTGRWALSQAFIVNGMYAEAIDLNEKFLQTDPTNQLFLRFAGYAYAKSNRRKEADAIINKFEELSKTEYVMSYKIANIYAALGEKDKAFAELEKAFENHDWEMFRLKVDPLMDPLRDDPRYKDLLKRMGLPE